jgi:predicted membrane channel-forming protein YqfA (hemolysin III family)
LELLRLKTVDKTADTTSSLFAALVVFLILLLFLIMISIGIALVLGEMTGRASYGFFILGGFYFIIGLIFYLFRKKWLKKPFGDLIIKKIL